MAFAVLLLGNIAIRHRRDPRFCAWVQALSAVRKAASFTGRALRDWSETGGPARRLRTFMAELDWLVVASWLWSHRSPSCSVCLDPQRQEFRSTTWDEQLHELRESWRRAHFQAYISSSRHETAAMRVQGARYNERIVAVLTASTYCYLSSTIYS